MKYRSIKDPHTFIVLILAVLSLTSCLFLASCQKEDKKKADDRHIFLLDLESNPDSGFEWEVSQADKLFEVEKEYEAAKSGKKQDGGTDHFTLTPIEAGFTDVIFTYKKPGKKGEEGAQYTYTILVGEDLHIEIFGSSGMMGGAKLGSKNIPEPGIK